MLRESIHKTSRKVTISLREENSEWTVRAVLLF